jgi:uncharacterized protein YecT (DUF1311 family)
MTKNKPSVVSVHWVCLEIRWQKMRVRFGGTIKAMFGACLALSANFTPLLAESVCDKSQTQMAMNECAHMEMIKADAALNFVYKRLMAQLDSKEKIRLRDAQRA